MEHRIYDVFWELDRQVSRKNLDPDKALDMMLDAVEKECPEVYDIVAGFRVAVDENEVMAEDAWIELGEAVRDGLE